MRVSSRATPTAPTTTQLVRAPPIPPRTITRATGAVTRTSLWTVTRAATRTATTTRIPATAMATTTPRISATGTFLTPLISSWIVSALSVDSMAGTIGSVDVAASTAVADSGDLAEEPVTAALGTAGGTAVSGDVEEVRLSLPLEDPDVRPSRAVISAPEGIADTLSVADSGLDPDAPVSPVGSEDLGLASAGTADSVIRLPLAVFTAAAASARARPESPEEDARPLDRPEGAEGDRPSQAGRDSPALSSSGPQLGFRCRSRRELTEIPEELRSSARAAPPSPNGRSS